jgi:hypothetical protein
VRRLHSDTQQQRKRGNEIRDEQQAQHKSAISIGRKRMPCVFLKLIHRSQWRVASPSSARPSPFRRGTGLTRLSSARWTDLPASVEPTAADKCKTMAGHTRDHPYCALTDRHGVREGGACERLRAAPRCAAFARCFACGVGTSAARCFLLVFEAAREQRRQPEGRAEGSKRDTRKGK